MMFCFKSILQIWIILIGFRDTNDFVNPGICKHEFKFTCHGYCRFTLKHLTVRYLREEFLKKSLTIIIIVIVIVASREI